MHLYYYPGENSKLVKNYFVGEYRGLMSVRTALKLSENVPAVKVLAQITPQVGFNYLLKFGFQHLFHLRKLSTATMMLSLHSHSAV